MVDDFYEGEIHVTIIATGKYIDRIANPPIGVLASQPFEMTDGLQVSVRAMKSSSSAEAVAKRRSLALQQRE